MSNSPRHTEFKKFSWYNLIDNGDSEIRFLRDHFKFSKSHLHDVAAPPLRPKVEFADEYVFIVLLYPIYNRKTGIVRATEIDLFANKKFIVTVHKNEINPIKDLAQKMQSEPYIHEKYSNSNSINLLLDILENMNLGLYPMLNHVAWDIDNIDSQLFTDHERELVGQILSVKRNIVAIRKTMSTQKNVLEDLSDNSKEYFGVKDEKRFNRIINSSKDIWMQLETNKATIDAIQESNESTITFRLNDIMKTLTIFSVVVFPLTLLAAIFGMNTIEGMPFMGNLGFWKVISIMGFGTIFMFMFFKKNKWI
jgi:magnesium transporter